MPHNPIDLVLYRAGERIETQAWLLHGEFPTIDTIHTGYEAIDYEIFGGMIVMELTKKSHFLTC